MAYKVIRQNNNYQYKCMRMYDLMEVPYISKTYNSDNHNATVTYWFGSILDFTVNYVTWTEYGAQNAWDDDSTLKYHNNCFVYVDNKDIFF